MKKFNPADTGRTVALRTYLVSLFDAMGIRGFYREASSTGDISEFPYVVFEIDHTDAFDDSGAGRVYEMEVNAYTDKSDSELDNMLDFIEDELVGCYTNNKFTISVKLGFGRIDVQEEPPIKRKRVLFNLKYWYGEC